MMMDRVSRLCLKAALGLSVLLLPACASHNVEKVKMEETVTYKTVDDGRLEISWQGNPLSTEEYTIEKGSDGTWSSSAMVKPAQPNMNERNVRLDFGQGLAPGAYSEDANGATPLKVYIAFLADSATLNVEQGGNPPIQQTLPGKFDMVMPEYLLGDPKAALYHLAAIMVHAYVEKGATAPMALAVMGNPNKVIVKELEGKTLSTPSGDVSLRHFTIDPAGGKVFQHVWVTADELKLVKLQIPRYVDAVKAGFEGAEQLVVERPKPRPKPKPAPAPTIEAGEDWDGSEAVDAKAPEGTSPE